MLPFSTAAAGAGEAPKRTHPAPWRVPDPDGPKIVKLRSEKVFLNAGEKVWWCSCGLSKEQVRPNEMHFVRCLSRIKPNSKDSCSPLFNIRNHI